MTCCGATGSRRITTQKYSHSARSLEFGEGGDDEGGGGGGGDGWSEPGVGCDSDTSAFLEVRCDVPQKDLVSYNHSKVTSNTSALLEARSRAVVARVCRARRRVVMTCRIRISSLHDYAKELRTVRACRASGSYRRPCDNGD